MIPPDTVPPPRPRICPWCDEPLADDRKYVCLACTEASVRAINAAGPGVVVRPSDVAREREKG